MKATSSYGCFLIWQGNSIIGEIKGKNTLTDAFIKLKQQYDILKHGIYDNGQDWYEIAIKS